MDTKISADEDDRLLQMANVVYQKMQIFNIGNLQQAAIIEEIVTFLYTGNFDCDIDNIFKSGTDKKCCMNVTFYCNSEEIRKVHQHRMLGHLACPFDAFFPVPLREQLTDENFERLRLLQDEITIAHIRIAVKQEARNLQLPLQ